MVIDTQKKIKMTVTMDVTIPQGLALRAMFDHWNWMANIGRSREVAFYVDGDGNFHPHVECKFNEEMPPLDDLLRNLAKRDESISGKDRFGYSMSLFDFDAIAWQIGHDE
jgi:hypothetical protein